MERRIEGPDKELLTDEEAAKWLNIETESFKTEVRSGRFPFKAAYGVKTRRWPWMDVVCYAYMLQRHSSAVAKEKSDTDEGED